MSGELFVKVCMALITIIGAFVSAYVIPYLKSKIGEIELDKVTTYVSVAVRCAEQIYTTEQWQEKKEYVMDYVMNIINSKLKINLSYDELDTIVEGIVNEIKHGSTSE
jgi:ethanolamine utilization protein EutQ (cupin superfamily)